jgi:ketosteroid isomerase-like protein
MTLENVQLVQRLVKAYNERDVDTLDSLTDPDFEFFPYLATLIETTIYRGRDGLRSYFADADAAWETIKVRLDEVREVNDRTVSSGELHGKGRASGLEVRVPMAWVGESRDGRLVRLERYASMDAALEAVGLED